MDRNEGIVRWSPNRSRDEFMVFNLKNGVVQLYEATGHARPGRFDHQKISKHAEFPAVNTYDWSPNICGLVAVGTTHGEVHLLRVDDNSNANLTLPLKLQRSCQSVAFNTTGLLAVGLDRVRNDACLQIWDVNQRLGDWDPAQKGWSVPSMNLEPKKKLEGSTSITSIRFFEDQPQTLIAGVKQHSVRIHDLRDPSSSVLTFATKHNNNIAIDYLDQNYFASSNLDQPGLLIWDRRVSTRSLCSPLYLESFDQDEVPWGAVLKLERAIKVEKNVFIKQLRYSREHRGALGILSTAGQLQVLQTRKEFIELGSSNDVRGSPEMLEVRKSFDLEFPYFDPNHKRRSEERIVSFDWLNLGTTDLPGRVVVLRATGEFEILELPATTTTQLSQFIPWQPPYRDGDPYLTLMKFTDPSERDKVLGPLYATAAKTDVPAFGPNRYTSKATVNTLASAIKVSLELDKDPIVDLLHSVPMEQSDTSESNAAGSTGRLSNSRNKNKSSQAQSDKVEAKTLKHFSRRELHDKSHPLVVDYSKSTKAEKNDLYHFMLHRSIAGYLFDCKLNKSIITADEWLQDLWDWVAGAEEAARNDGMVSEPLDLSYMGVWTIWMNHLGEKSSSRLIDSTIIPDATQWERHIAEINKKAGRPPFAGIHTAKPQHRQLCLAICGYMKTEAEFEEDIESLKEQDKYTTAAAWALFAGRTQRAVEILKSAGTELLFVAMALDLKSKSGSSIANDSEQWGEALKTHPGMADDPYLRAIYGYIASGNWSAIVEETSLPLRDRVGVALRNFEDAKLTDWLSMEMEEAIHTGDLEGIVLAGITDNMVDIFAKYVDNVIDYQTAILVMSFCYPRYIDDIRCEAWRKSYKDFLQRHKKFILRVKFEQQSTVKSRLRDGQPVIKQPPRQVTLRCLNCDAHAANDLGNSGQGTRSTSRSAPATADTRNPLQATGTNAGLCCPKCGAKLPRCAICLEIVGVPRSDKPEMSLDPEVRRMANFPTFCLKCKHVTHMEHSMAWFKRHMECPVPECHCQCNSASNLRKEIE